MVRSFLVVVGIALVAVACSDSNANTDLGVVEPGCRSPSACWKVGSDCSCLRAQVAPPGNDDLGEVSSCMACNPLVDTCYCTTNPLTLCIDANSVCTGRAATTCLGAGARCLPAHASCASSGGNPPQLVGTGENGALEPRCQYADDVCCPGSFDLATPPDLSAPDQSIPDLGESD